MAKSAAPLPSLKLVMDFFNATPALQKLYAERVSATMANFMSGVQTEYPHQLNTPGDIADFVIKHRSYRVNEQADSLSDAFLLMHLTETKGKRKNKEERPQSEKKMQKDQPKPIQSDSTGKAKSSTPTNRVGLLATLPKRPLTVGLSAIPTALSYFPSSRASAFSSAGGLHDVSCEMCREIGFYNVLPNGKRGLALQQKRWAEVLHQVMTDGKTVVGVEKLEACAAYRPKPKEVAEMDVDAISAEVLTAQPNGAWGESKV